MMILPAAESRILAHPGGPPQLISMILAHQVPGDDGTVLDWVTYLNQFSRRDWAEWVTNNFIVDGLTFSVEEWEHHWAMEEQDHPERVYPLNWILPFLRLHDLTTMYRAAVRLAMAQERRARAEARNRFSP